MKTIFSALALAAGLAMGLMGGAQAQTITGVNSSGATIFTVDIAESTTPPPSPYTYTYVATLTGITAGQNVNVNQFAFSFDPTADVTYLPVESSNGYAYSELTPGQFSFGTATGLTTVGQSTQFIFSSPLPPNGSVSADSTSPAIAGGGTTSIGPGPAVPEPASLALLGLGALPLGLLARRRMAAK